VLKMRQLTRETWNRGELKAGGSEKKSNHQGHRIMPGKGFHWLVGGGENPRRRSCTWSELEGRLSTGPTNLEDLKKFGGSEA